MEKVIVITGGSNGIGAAVVTQLAAHKIFLLDRTEPSIELNNNAAEDSLKYIACDLSDKSSIEGAIGRIPGRIDSLINVAGVSNAADSATILTVNFLALRQMTESLVSRINDGGSVVNVASTAGYDWRSRKPIIDKLLATSSFEDGWSWLEKNKEEWAANPYKFSKQCAAAYTYLAAGLAVHRRVRVNCVNPGSTGTQLTPDFRELVGEEMYDWGVNQVGREGRPEDIAEVIEFLAVGKCSWLNGVELTVDGGYIAGLTSGWVDLTQSPNQ